MPSLEANYNETQVPAYELPDLLRFENGELAQTPDDWRRRRSELLALFRSQVYGQAPPRPANMRAEVYESSADALDGLAVRRQIRLHFDVPEITPLELLIYLPAHVEGPTPMFAGLNFFGNHTVQDDPAITLSSRWMRASDPYAVVNHRATEASRGKAASRWPVREIVGRGYGVATMYYGDLAPDNADFYRDGVQGLFAPDRTGLPGAEEAGAIGIWAWGLQRILDYLETDEQADATRVTAVGHSRLGKAAVWAAAQDERFAMAISNNSGCTGAALSRRCFGETVGIINEKFPHWFCGNYKRYSGRENALPLDQHMFLALLAPRPIYVASADEDLWADPLGEFLALKAAEPVYHLLGMGGLSAEAMPPIGEPVHGVQSYHIRQGTHGITSEDWAYYLDHADRFLVS
ncbi:acetylxylan esterase [Phycisphaerales bacterium AB-hyl4]|uniref:Acetylxylan esterase n=1 Tax=Natronomicrosphaera hydrolytica TaxID=3242702 RepID=A0ABV4U305_9BACT